MEISLNYSLQNLFYQASQGTKNSLNKIIELNSLLAVNKTEVVLEIEQELESFFKAQKETVLVEQILSQNKEELKYINFNNQLYEIAPVNLVEFYSQIFKKEEYKYIKLSYLFNPQISQKLILLSNLKGILNAVE